MFECLDAPIERVTAAPVPVPFAPVMESFVIPDAEQITDAARKLVRYEIQININLLRNLGKI